MATVVWSDEAESAFARAEQVEWSSLAANYGDDAVSFAKALDAYERGERVALTRFKGRDTAEYEDAADDTRERLRAMRARTKQLALEVSGADHADPVAQVQVVHVRGAVLQVLTREYRELHEQLDFMKQTDAQRQRGVRPDEEEGE